tara:strand:- start:954 stop:1301 length:348 start_codon:yes stop_codon:yes gene_type:complete
MFHTIYGGYFIIDNGDITTYVYTKISKEQMIRALPLSYDEKTYDDDKQYLVCIIKDVDYIGMATYDDIKNTLSSLHIIDILNTDYTNIPDIISKEKYDNTKQFITEQIKYINTKQ